MESVRVLLVDDEIEFAEALGDRLQTRGFTTAVSDSGDAALDRLGGEDYDVVILDLFMPGRNGLETLREIKQRTPLTEVIMLSGKGTEETAIEGMKYGAFDFLVKPPDVEDLVDKLEDAHAKKEEHMARIQKAQAAGEKGEMVVEELAAVDDGEVVAHEGRLLALGRDSEFSEGLIDYALEMAERLSYEILAVNAAGFSEESFRSFPSARKRVWRDFCNVSEESAARFRKAASEKGIRFAHQVKFSGRDLAIREVAQEVGEIDFVVSEPEDEIVDPGAGPHILVYSPA